MREGAAAEPQPDTLALLTASLSAKLADAVSELVGAAYAARIVRIEPKAHGATRHPLVEFLPRPPDHTLKTALGEKKTQENLLLQIQTPAFLGHHQRQKPHAR